LLISSPSDIKKPAAKSRPVSNEPGLFSYLFNVAASRPAKSPRDSSGLLHLPACVNWTRFLLSRQRETKWPAFSQIAQ
jgi:hypothetical protein